MLSYCCHERSAQSAACLRRTAACQAAGVRKSDLDALFAQRHFAGHVLRLALRRRPYPPAAAASARDRAETTRWNAKRPRPACGAAPGPAHAFISNALRCLCVFLSCILYVAALRGTRCSFFAPTTAAAALAAYVSSAARHLPHTRAAAGLSAFAYGVFRTQHRPASALALIRRWPSPPPARTHLQLGSPCTVILPSLGVCPALARGAVRVGALCCVQEALSVTVFTAAVTLRAQGSGLAAWAS